LQKGGGNFRREGGALKRGQRGQGGDLANFLSQGKGKKKKGLLRERRKKEVSQGESLGGAQIKIFEEIG